MLSHSDIISMICVGAIWGCTNPFVRKGTSDGDDTATKPSIQKHSDVAEGDGIDKANDLLKNTGSNVLAYENSYGSTISAMTSKSSASSTPLTHNEEAKEDETEVPMENQSFLNGILRSLSQFKRPKVFIPYLMNQCGSLLYYIVLATSELTIAVPACNALALLFSSLTSFALGERIDKPLRGAIGAGLVTLGVGICIKSSAGLGNDIGTGAQEQDEL